jgi:hypothetical protein
MPVLTLQLTSTAVPKRLSDAYPGANIGVVDAALDIPYRQLIIQASAAVTISDTAAKAAQGIPIGVGGTLTLGPFDTGPLKLSEFWVTGAATVTILGIPF